MTTQFFNSTQNNPNMLSNINNSGTSNSGNNSGSSSISKTIAQAKLRKQRANRGASNPNNPMHQQLDHNISLNGTHADYQHMNSGGNNNFNVTTTNFATHNRKRSIQGGGGNNNFGTNVNSLNATMNIGTFTGANSSNMGPDGNSNSGNHTAISGGRKPTADSHAYTLYKPNK